MADFPISLDKLKRIWHSEVHDPQKWSSNMRILRAAGIFVGSIVVMRNFGELLVNEST
ncbi:hypothetical protein RND81_13G109700 [Saponaria officinalis]|uniref:Mitochondrial import receptor subunit TOM5 homolog n=1 Tax=Saponaria officinalis TaxID=3572 RepID=A0AAW1H120_SAPOF